MKQKILLMLALWLSLVGNTWAQNNALHFDGIDDYVVCPSINPTYFTVEAWVYPTALGKEQVILSTANYDPSSMGFELQIDADNVPKVSFRESNGWITAKAIDALEINTWTHLAVTYDASNLKLYVNGVLVQSRIASQYVPGTYELSFGRKAGSDYCRFTGKIDKARVWSKARSQFEIAAAMNNTIESTETDLLACFDFDQGTANGNNGDESSLIDATSNVNNGTLNNFDLSGETSNWVEGATSTIGLSRTLYEIDSIASSHKIDIITDIDWQATCSVSWITLSKTSGTGNDNVTFTAEALPEGVAERYASIVFTGIYQPIAVLITQKKRPNNALHFDGVSDYVICKPIAPSQFTVEAWVYLDDLSGLQTIVSNSIKTSAKNFRFNFYNDKLNLYVGVGPNNSILSSEYTFEANRWYHVAATCDGSVAKLYVNGVQDANTLSVSSFVTAEEMPLCIGVHYHTNSYAYFFKGKIDDVRVWSYVRSEEEIFSDMNNQTTNETGLLAWYNFNQGVANSDNTGVNTLYDASDNLNDGTLKSFILNGTTSNWIEGCSNKYLDVSALNTKLTSNAGSTTVLVESNTDWELINTAGWLTPSIEMGNGNATITIDYAANSGSYVERTSWLAFAAEGTDTFFVSFTQQPEITITAGLMADNVILNTIPATVSFTDTSTSTGTTITSWAWDFGDGGKSTEQNPVHIYANQGSYTISLIVSDGTVSDTIENVSYITVSTDLISGCGEVIISDSVYFYDTGGPNGEYDNMEGGGAKFKPAIPGASIKIEFISFNVQAYKDYLYVYYGEGQSATLTGGGNNSFQSTYADGRIRTLFRSDYMYTNSGWKALVTQVMPKASFEVSDTVSWVNSEIGFTDTGFLSGLNGWSWDFGDGSNSTEQNPSHTYTSAGTYTVTLTTSNGIISQSASRQIRIVDAVTASFSADITSGYRPTVQFANLSIGETYHEWDFGDGSEISTDENPSHTYSIEGTYTVTLTATDAAGNSNQATMEIVAENITPAFSANVTAGYQPVVQFADATVGATSWSWDFGDGSDLSIEQNPQHTYTTAGVFDVSLTVSDGDNTNTLTYENYITSNPIIVDFNADKTIGALQTVNFTDTSQGNITSWEWDFGDGSTSTEQNPTHKYQSAGTYTVSLTVSDAYNTEVLVKEDYIVTDLLLMSNDTVTLTDGPIRFYDSGGLLRGYSAYESYKVVLYPSEPDKTVHVDFNSFRKYGHYDVLEIYDGANTDSSIIAIQSGTYALSVTATNSSGALCLFFKSFNYSNPDDPYGWDASITQVDKESVLTWSTPDAITYGTALSSEILNAKGNMPGTITYNYPTGTVLNAGVNTLTATFTPDDDNYQPVVKSVGLVVKKVELLTTADNKIITAGRPVPELTVSYSGFVNGDDVDDIDIYPMTTSSITETSKEGEYSIFVLGGIDNNYNFSYQTGVLTITDRQTPEISWANPADITYGTVLSETQLNASTIIEGAFTYSPDLGTKLDAGDDQSLSVTFVPEDIDSYVETTIIVTINVAPAPLTVTAHNQRKVYGEDNPELTFSYSGWMNNDDENDLDEEPTISTTINELSGVGTYADSIIFSGGSDNNYTFDFVPGDFEITPATLTVTADNKSKVYGDSNPELTFSYSGWKNGEESIDVAPIISTTIDELSGVGTYADSIILGGGSDNNYTFDFVPGAIEITPATLTVTADNKSKVYGDINPELTFSYSGWVNGEESIDVAPIISTTIDELSGVGTYANSIILSGGSDNNYTFDFVPGAIEITPATLTVTADNKSKVYGDINPELTFSYSGWMNNDDENDLDEEPTISTTINKLSSVGTYADSIIFSGGSDNNYSFNFVPGTIEITPATLTVTAHNQTKVYGQDNPELTFVYSGWKNGEESIDVAPIISTTIDELSGVGTYADSIILGGGSDNNYTFDFVPGAIEITPATLTVTADNKTKVYGQGNPELTISYAGFMNGDDTSNLTTLPTINLDGDGVNVGEYDILVAGAQSENYEFKYTNGTLNVEKAQLIVSADNKSAYYNQPIPELTITYSGFQYGEDVSNLTTVPTASTAAVQGSPEGDYNIDVSGGVADNYSFNYVEGVLTISPKQMPVLSWSAPADITYGTPLGFAQLNAVAIVGTDTIDGTFDYTPDLGTVLHTGNSQALHVAFTPDNDALYESVSGDNTINVTKAPLTVIAVNDTIVYGEPIPELNVSYSGFVNGDDAGVLNVEPVASLAAGDGINAGDYTISLSATSSDDYEITYQTGVFVVEKATLTVTAHNQTKVYGQSNPVLTFEYDGFVNNDGIADLDEEPTISTTINALSNAGLYADSIILSGGAAENYAFNLVPGNFEITQAPLTVTAHNQTKVYGQSNPVLTFEYDGFVNNDGIADLDEEPTISTTINALSNAGLYADSIILSGGAAENYAFNLVPGNFEITKAQLTVKADKKIRTYGCNNPELTYTCSGWVNGVETLDVEPNIRTSITAADRVDLYFRAITLSGGSDNNYDLKLIPGDFKIVKADLYVTANDESKVYGQPNPNLGFTYKGFVNNDNIDSIDVLPLLSTRVADSTDAGFYANAIKLSGGQDNNYKFKFNPGDFEVSKSTLTVTAHNQIRAFGESNPEFTFDVEGFVNNDSISEIDTMPVAGTVADENSPLGEYAIELSGGTDNNYTFEYIDGVLSINGKASPVISWDKPAPIVYGTTLGIAQLNATANAAGTFSYSPAEGAVLEAGTAQQLSVVFTPSDTVNYQPAQRSVSLDVNPAMLTVRADSCKVFQGSPIPGLGCRVDGFVHGENIEVLSVMPQVSTTASSSSQPGVYPITASGAQAQNYEFTYVEAALEIIERHTPEVEWETPAAIVYGTALNSSQLNAVADVAGTYVYSPSEGSILEAGQAQELSLLFIPDDTVSYTRVEKTVSLEVQPAVLNVSANDASVVYGQELPVFDYSISGFVNGETDSNLLALPEAVSEEDNRPEAGTYPIVARGGSSNNYVFEYHNGTLSVGKATVRVIVRDTTMKRGEALPEFSVDYEGLVYGQSSANLEQQAAVSTTATADSPVGEYELVPAGAADSNYQFEYVNGTLTIEAGTSFAEIALMDARVYPNPFVGELTIQVNPGIEAEYTLSTLSGQTIVVGAIQQAITPVDLPVLRGGVYLLQLRYNGSTRTFRVLKK